MSCQLVSGTGTNLIHHREGAFDGTTFYDYTADFRRLTKTSDATLDGPAGGEEQSTARAVHVLNPALG